MSTNTLILLLILFCIGMSAAIAVIVVRQRRALKLNQQRIVGLQQMLETQYNNRVESIILIARAMADKQCEPTEGCIRLKQLLDQIEPELLKQDQYKVIALIYSSTEHMPIKEQWKQLEKKAKHKYTQHRLALEIEHAEEINAAATALVQHGFPAYQSLG
jgi:hypothetical protein